MCGKKNVLGQLQELPLVKGRKKGQSISEERKMRRKGCLRVHGPVKNAGGAVKWRAGGHTEMLGCLRRGSQREGRQAKRGGYVYVASSTYFSILAPFPVNKPSAVTLSGPD